MTALEVFAAAAYARRLAGVAVVTADPVVAHISRHKGFRSFDGANKFSKE
jgi:hypothetical protein